MDHFYWETAIENAKFSQKTQGYRVQWIIDQQRIYGVSFLIWHAMPGMEGYLKIWRSLILKTSNLS